MPDPLIDPLLRRWLFPMVRIGNTFAIPYGMEARQHLIESGEYPAPFLPFLERFLTEAVAGAWAPGSYYPGGWYRAAAAQGRDPTALRLTTGDFKPFWREELRVDDRGHWWLGPKPVTGRVLNFFLRHLEFDSALALYRIRYPLESIEEIQYIHPESPPLRAIRIDSVAGPQAVHLNDGTVEPLDPGTLWLDRRDRLFARLGRWNQAVEFDDPARWDLLRTLEQHEGRWFVAFGTQRVELPVRD